MHGHSRSFLLSDPSALELETLDRNFGFESFGFSVVL